MGLEDNIRLVVEQVLAEMSKSENFRAPVTTAGYIPGKPVDDPAPAQNGGWEETRLKDLTAIDLQKHLQVPNPVNKTLYEEMKMATPARIGVWRTGSRPLTETLLRFRADHATAQDAVLSEVSEEFIQKLNLVKLQSACRDKDEYLTRPDLGRKLSTESLEKLRKSFQKGADVQIIVSDGLSSKAVEANLPDLLPALMQGLSGMGIKIGTPVFVKYGRVAVMDVIGEELKPKVAIIFLGERPGLGTAESLSAYLAYNPRQGMIESERTVVSNIHKGGTPAPEAGAYLVTLLKKVLDKKASGVNLE
ncbi:ethanolamine ammonia-lyase subunit EutC [Zhaonella formicivorans]|uniref:ethanolamine ammonia-lyase subunit EutC n=1 Tax=Zhaonella formicivorans TaxID=2528593 RepID=UPI0010D6F418|nr:ethanolamine ammonia-lyase subunit EutC [Zhaonella formicivorans]